MQFDMQASLIDQLDAARNKVTETNGSVESEVVRPSDKPEPIRRERTVKLGGEYTNYTVTLWVNYPRQLLTDIRSGNTSRVESALSQIVVRHNDWPTHDGRIIPQPTDPKVQEARIRLGELEQIAREQAERLQAESDESERQKIMEYIAEVDYEYRTVKLKAQGFFDLISDEQLAIIMLRAQEEAGKFVNSVIGSKGSTSRG